MRRLADIFHEKSEVEKYGKGTIVCNSMEEFDEAIKDIKCGLVSPGGTGLPRPYIEYLEKEGLIRVFRVWHDDNFFKYDTSIFRFLVPSKEIYIYIPEDDVKKFKDDFKRLEGEYL